VTAFQVSALLWLQAGVLFVTVLRFGMDLVRERRERGRIVAEETRKAEGGPDE
jgi:selenophosphate synthase